MLLTVGRTSPCRGAEEWDLSDNSKLLSPGNFPEILQRLSQPAMQVSLRLHCPDQERAEDIALKCHSQTDHASGVLLRLFGWDIPVASGVHPDSQGSAPLSRDHAANNRRSDANQR
jgi:hypothetical protein